MLADQFQAAAAAARNTHAIDEIARLTWRAHAERQLQDTEAQGGHSRQWLKSKNPAFLRE